MGKSRAEKKPATRNLLYKMILLARGGNPRSMYAVQIQCQQKYPKSQSLLDSKRPPADKARL